MVDRVRLGLRALFRRGVIEREMDDEIRLHLERATERLVRRGLSPQQARATARREFGNVESLKEEGRDARGGRWLEETVSDIRYGLRGLKKTPVFTTVALTSLILGIGVNTALFTMLKVAFRPSPVDEPATLVEAHVNLPYPVFEEIRARSPSLVDVFARSTERLAIRGVNASEEPTRVTAELVTSEFFRALRGVPLLGRTFAPDEATAPGREPVAVLSYRMWRSRFGGDSAVIGRSLQLASGTTLTIVGVMPLEFTGADRHTPDFWIPMTMRSVLPATYQIEPARRAWFTDPMHGWLRLGGRLRDGATTTQVFSQIEAALLPTDTTRRAEPLQQDDVTTADGSGISGHEWVPVSLVALATFLVLLIACANVANLMLARAAARRREIAVRQCLGASRSRLVRQLLVESSVLAVMGGVGALVMVAVALRLAAISGMLAAIASGDPELVADQLAPDRWVLACALGMSLISALVVGLIPAWRATDGALLGAVKSDSGAFGQRVSRSRLRNGLVIAQVALSLVLLLSAGLLVRSSTRALSFDPGFDRQNVVVVSADLQLAGYDHASARRFEASLETSVASLSGVQSIARGGIPLAQRSRAILTPNGWDGASYRGWFATAEPTYFATTGVAIARGRAFSVDDVRAGAEVVIVTEATARAFWPNENPLGKVLGVAPGGKSAAITPEAELRSARVVGVARDAHMVDLGVVPTAFVYVPGGGPLLVRTTGNAAALVTSVRTLARSIDPAVIVDVASLAQLIASEDEAVLGARLGAGFAVAMGLLALSLAATGLFGVVAYAVAQRTRELGVRVALGALPSQVRTLVIRQGMRHVLIGGALGLAGGLGASRVLGALLFGMSPLDPAAYLGAAAVLGAVALLACYIPARRATRVDPLIALRHE